MENLSFSPGESSLPKENVNLRHYWHVVLERRWLVITAFVSVFILSLIYLYKAPRIYEAIARMEIDRDTENVLNLKDALSIEGRDLDYWQTQYKNLKSRKLIHSVITQLHLEKDPRYAKQRDYHKAVEADIQIVPIRLSRLVDIKVQHPNPQTGAKIANTLVNQFIDDNLNLRRDKWIELARFLQSEADTLETKVKNADKALQKYREEKKSVSLEERQNIDLQTLMLASTDLSKAASDAAVAQTNAAEVTRWEQEGFPLESIPQVAEDVSIKDLQNKLDVEKTKLEALLTRYKSKWPQVQESRAAIGQLTKAIGERATNIIASIKKKAELFKSHEQTLRNQVAQKEEKVMELNKQRIEYDTLSRDLKSKRDLLDKVMDKRQETEIASKSKSNNMREVYPAEDPLKPIKPRFILTLFLGLFGGFGVAVGLAFFVNYLDDSIKSQDDVETYLRLPFLGYVPNIKTNSLVERDLQAHVHPRSNAAEGFRTIRAAISLMPKAEKFRILTVTSTIPSEGKSLLASNLAIVSAQTGLKTLLVDADLRRPSVHKAFQLHCPVGLSAYLTEGINSFEECIQSTEVPNLDVVCCGAIPSTPSELIGSRRMMQFLQEVRVRYDRIVLDCPPVSAVSDPLVLASKSDGVIFVTKFNKIRREHARRTIQRLQDAGIHILGVILNDIDFEGKDSYYYSYYYYQNRYYASHYKSEKNGSEKTPEKTPEKSKRA